MKRYFHRHLPTPVWRFIPVAGLGTFLSVVILGAITQYGDLPLLIAPFGASCVLIFAAHSSPLSQPINVVGGHVVAGLVGLVCHFILPGSFVMAAVAVAVAIMGMMALRVVHPPAGATALVAYVTAVSWSFIIFPVLIGSILLVGLGLVYHQVTDNIYPLHHPEHLHRLKK